MRRQAGGRRVRARHVEQHLGAQLPAPASICAQRRVALPTRQTSHPGRPRDVQSAPAPAIPPEPLPQEEEPEARHLEGATGRWHLHVHGRRH